MASALDEIRNIGLSYAVLRLARDGKKDIKRDANDYGKDDLIGNVKVTGAMLIDELADGESNKHEAIATALEALAERIRAEGKRKK